MRSPRGELPGGYGRGDEKRARRLAKFGHRLTRRSVLVDAAGSGRGTVGDG